MAYLGGALILFGVTLLVLVDAPRRALMRLTALGVGRRTRGGAPAAEPGPRPDTGAPVPSRGVVSPVAYLGLAPGWYRDPSSPALARYWDGRTLGEERRSVTTSPAPGVASPLAAYQGLTPGWYRDASTADTARYWNGTTLSEERRLVSP